MTEETWTGNDTGVALTIIVVVMLTFTAGHLGCRLDHQAELNALRLRSEACLAIGGSLINNDCIPPCLSLEEITDGDKAE